jgi:molybdopterin-guanine dinucleotide biosynthesis protein B
MIKLAIVGAKKSGKTMVMEGLIKYLHGKGYRVATIKHSSHRHRFDIPGKDSYRHREAGAGLTMAVSENEIAVFTRPDLLDAEQVQSLARGRFDIWLIEGKKSSDHAKILVTRKLKEFSEPLPTNVVATIGPERIEGVPAHFESGDYNGLGSYIISAMLDKKMETRQ